MTYDNGCEIGSEYDPDDDDEDCEFDPEAELDMMFPDGVDDGVSPDTWPWDNN